MLTCLPQSLCSWDYRITGATASPATLTFDWFSEEGSLTLGPANLTIRKHGLLSGRWTLENGGNPIVEAHKRSPFLRQFDVRMEGEALVLQAQTPFTRRYDILMNAGCVGTIAPMHLFTRRATIACHASIPEAVQLFCFWLAVITWRRASRNNN